MNLWTNSQIGTSFIEFENSNYKHREKFLRNNQSKKHCEGDFARNRSLLFDSDLKN